MQTHIGPREVLRVALMRGALDDVRNDMARALAGRAAPPAALAALLRGLEGIGVDLSDARRVLGACAEGEPSAVDPREVGLEGGEERRAERGEGVLPEEGRGSWVLAKENAARGLPEPTSTSHARPAAGRRRRRANRKLSKVRR